MHMMAEHACRKYFAMYKLDEMSELELFYITEAKKITFLTFHGSSADWQLLFFCKTISPHIATAIACRRTGKCLGWKKSLLFFFHVAVQ